MTAPNFGFASSYAGPWAKRETVILAEPGTVAIRTVQVLAGTRKIVERWAKGQLPRVWVWQQEERATGGIRVFREVIAPLTPEPSESPLYDELDVKL